MKQFNIDPGLLEHVAADRTEWNRAVSKGSALFGSAYNAAELARRNRRHNQPTDGAYQCTECARRLVTLAGLRSHLRAHQRRLAAGDGRAEGEEDVVIEPDGPP